MSSGPIRNVPRRRRAQTPFYPLIEAQPSPSTSRLRVIPAQAHHIIEIMSDNEAAGQAASVIDLTTTDDEVASQVSVDVHREPTITFAVAAEDVVEILSDDEATQQHALAAATTELENLRAAIRKVWFSQFDSVMSLHIIGSQRSSLKGILLWSALDISTLPLPSAVILAVTRRFGRIPFTCPTCRDLVGKHQPYKVIALGQLSNALSSLGGEQGEEDPSMDWTGYFSVS
ncbi:uncharacterized protein F5891DRAFT_1183789 [Suillus fuscotomentosus]|uniref:Uncharacterized protein n=1 Tax=Suillus fuscotomentosus TaxID=1912939 RepID=A0AAD4HQB4_9AGAM|nr:uncharacterized protein F5891DRAFT_1183789 [Suillus fuscotomentosus]KAG1905083.1 hypothetical protein F5891DRAFT_1183789 [Suillus fuscotomentosus]